MSYFVPGQSLVSAFPSVLTANVRELHHDGETVQALIRRFAGEWCVLGGDGEDAV